MKAAPIEVHDFTRIYDPSAGQTRGYAWYVNDHAFVRGEDGTWHLFGITQQNPFRPFEEVFFTHVTAPALLGPWTRQADVMHADEAAGETVVWAPHVIRHDRRWWMFYCGGDADPARFRINLATSEDLWTWIRAPQNPLLQDGYHARDPMVLRIGDQWVLYYTANSAPEGGSHVVAAVTSRDLVRWSDKRVVFVSERSGTGGGPTESPFVVARGGRYLLFVCTNRRYIETAVYESDDPFAWTPAQRIATIPAHAAEVIETPDGETFISSCGWGMGGVYLAPLKIED
jgi:sucrose-6-phosphate hydrolase SacC (GH32 family)